MARILLIRVRNEAVRSFLKHRRELHIFGITLRIQHAHDNEYQVLLPDDSEIFRIVDNGTANPIVYTI